MRIRFLFAAVVVALITHSPMAWAQTPTFSRDVAPILYKNCVNCHRPGEMGPMSLLTYEDARPYARAIRAKVQDGAMPPWHAEAPRGVFLNDRRLTDADKTTLIAWADGGAPKGNAKDLPAIPKFAAGWEIGTPDAIVRMQMPFEVPAAGTIPYQYIEVPTSFAEDKWVQAIEIRPGVRSVVHHVLVFSREPNGTNRSPGFTTVVPKPLPPRPQADGAPRPATPNRGVLIATTAPGANAMTFRPGAALLIKAGSVLTFQIHYTANGETVKDTSSIGFVFAKQQPQQEMRTGAFLNAFFTIPAGANNEAVESAIQFNDDSHIWAIFPHTHVRGKSWEYRLVLPDGASRVVLSVPKYDFNWQTYYTFTEPLVAPKGARLEATAHYDNSVSNKANPDPNVAVRWGDQTWQEMQYSGITFTIDSLRLPQN